VILNDGDPSFPGFIAIDRAIRAALAAPGKHRVETFSEGLDMFRFQAAQVEDEIVDSETQYWIVAAAEQRPELAQRAAGYEQRRRSDIVAGRVTAVVQHTDVLVIPE